MKNEKVGAPFHRFFTKDLDIASFRSIMPVFVARCSMTFSRSADCPFHRRLRTNHRLGAKVNHITHFFFDRRPNER
jgi:hypothetical protein